MKPKSQHPEDAPRLVSENEAAEILGISVRTLQYWRAVSKGPRFVKLEGRVRYDVADLRAYIDANRSAATPVRASIGG